MHSNTTASHGNNNANASPAKNAAAKKLLPHGRRKCLRMSVSFPQNRATSSYSARRKGVRDITNPLLCGRGLAIVLRG